MAGFRLSDMDDIVEECWQDSGKWFPVNTNNDVGGEEHLTFLLLALTGEVGETCNVWKKYLRGSIEFENAIPMVKEELIDVFIYFCNLVKALDINVKEEYARKREYNQRRFGGGSPGSSVARTRVDL